MTEGEKGDKVTVVSIQHLTTLRAPSDITLRRADRHRPFPCRFGQGSARGLEAAGLTSITAVSILILSRFDRNGLAKLLDKFPVRFPSFQEDTRADSVLGRLAMPR